MSLLKRQGALLQAVREDISFLHYRKIIDVTAAMLHEIPREQVADRSMRYNAAFRQLTVG